MLKNYFKIAFRNLFRHKGYSLINITGLAIGIAACLIILRYVQFERSFDRFHEKADRILRVEQIVNDGQDRWASTQRNLGENLKAIFPEVEETTRLSSKDQPLIAYGERRFFESFFRYGDPSFFTLFDIEILQGSAEDLARPNTVMLRHEVAQKYFGDENPVGQVLEVSNKWEQKVELYEVVGLIEDIPGNSHFSIDFLASLATADEMYESMNRQTCFTYVLLKEGASHKAFEQKLARLDGEEVDWLYEKSKLASIPLTRIHLYGESKKDTDVEIQGSITLVYLFSLIALLIIVLACINYMNLATARAAQRAREVGVRKAVGAGRKQLILQFLGESFLFVVIALGFAGIIAQLALPLFNNLLGQKFAFEWNQSAFLQSVLLGTIITGLLAGSYPAFLLSRYKPSSVLKGSLKSTTWPLLRKGLVVFQFAVSIGFIAATFVIYNQLNYVTSEQLGFEQEQRLILMTRGRLGDNTQAFKASLERQSVVESVALSSGIPGHPTAISFFGRGDFEGAEPDAEGYLLFDHMWVDEDFFETFGLKLVAGRSFSPEIISDASDAVIINEAAAHTLGWKEDPVGKTFRDREKVKTVIGVIEDFHITSFKKEIQPMMLEMRLAQASSFVTVNLASNDFGSVLQNVEQVWDEYIPSMPLLYSFLDTEVEAMYREEVRLGRLFALFSGLAVLVACLGLFGLAAYTSMQRTKEIGIRKVLGASTTNLVQLLSSEYLKLVVIAFLFAAPLTYYFMQDWLQAFAYRIELGIWIFVAAGLMAFLIAILTVSYQSVKASLANPVEALRYE